MSAGPPGHEEEDVARFDQRRPLDPRDYSRRTLLANERTFLAWWRTGLAALTVALACARIVPELSDADHTWPYVAVGAGFGVAGVACIAFGEHRRRAVARAVEHGEFPDLDPVASLVMTATGVVLGVALLVLILVGP